MADIKSSPEVFLELLQSSKYSDFVLTCNEVEWKLHKAVVCIQSPVISAALNGPFTVRDLRGRPSSPSPKKRMKLMPSEKEAALGRISSNPDFDVATMARLVQFLYVGDYSSSPSLAGTWPSMEVLRDESRQVQPSPRCLEAEISLNIAADYYGISALSAMTRSRVKEVLENHWKAAIFPDLLKNAEENVQDKDLWQIMIDAAATHMDTLIKSKEFLKAKWKAETYVQIFCAQARKEEELRKWRRY